MVTNFFDSDFRTGFIWILLNLVCVRVSTHRSQVTNFSAVWTRCSFEFAICFLVSFLFHSTYIFQVFVSCLYLCLCLNLYLNICQCLPVSCVSNSTCLCQVSSFSTRLASLIFIPAVVPSMCLASAAVVFGTCQHSADVQWLWWLLVIACERYFRLESECLAMPWVLSTSSGSQALTDHIVTTRWSSVAQSLVSSSFETFLTHSRHTSSNGFSLGQLYSHFCETRRSRVSTKPLAQPGPSPWSNLCRVFTHNHFGSAGSVCCKHRVQHLLSTDFSRVCDDLYRTLCCSPVLGTGTEAALRSSADFTTCCDILSTSHDRTGSPRDSAAVLRGHHQDWCSGDWSCSPLCSTRQHSSATT